MAAGGVRAAIGCPTKTRSLKMIRKLFVLGVMAVAALAFSASNAAAQGVHVENPGHHEAESEVDIAVGVHIPGVGFNPLLQCENNWEVDAQEDGAFTLNAEDIQPHTGSVGACDTAEPCNHALWNGQLEEDGPGEFAAHLTFCLQETGTGLSGIPFALECPVEQLNVDSFHCDQQIATTPPEQGSLPIEVEGEVFLHESLGIMHG
jgi:hypothetical protein